MLIPRTQFEKEKQNTCKPRRKDNPLGNQATEMDWQFTEKEIKILDKKRCSMFLAVREMQTKKPQ